MYPYETPHGKTVEEEWRDTSAITVKSVVSIKFQLPYAFDGETAGFGEATGFVVDRVNGYILTNRHVVTTGPFTGTCIFYNQEEVIVWPAYTDPLHDYAMLQFDPHELKHMKLQSVVMVPERPTDGTKVCVMGNDAGNRLTIIFGDISRTDMNAPEYPGPYRDFNTNYYLVSGNMAGGASGSPAVVRSGCAVALVCGSSQTSMMLLPLDGPLRTLRLLQNGQEVSRGDIGARFVLRPFYECKRFGLSDAREEEMRLEFPDTTSLLVVDAILPVGPSVTKLEIGDVVIRVENALIVHFKELEDTFDCNVGEEIQLLVQRAGKDEHVQVTITDLHEVTPTQFLTVSGAVFHNLSYQMAMRHLVSVAGIYICHSEEPFRIGGTQGGYLLHAVDYTEVSDLAEFEEILKRMKILSQFSVKITPLENPGLPEIHILTYDPGENSRPRRFVQNSNKKTWDYTELVQSNELEDVCLASGVPQSCPFTPLGHIPWQVVAEVTQSIVHVECTLGANMDGYYPAAVETKGIVIDTEQRLVLVSSTVIPHSFCRVMISAAETIRAMASVLVVNLLGGYTIIQYSSIQLSSQVKAAKLSASPLTVGTEVYAVCYKNAKDLMHARTTVTNIWRGSSPDVPASQRLRFHTAILSIDSMVGNECSSGVLVSNDGTVQALWISFETSDGYEHGGINIAPMHSVIPQFRTGKIPELHLLPFEVDVISTGDALVLGLSKSWAGCITRANEVQPSVYRVRKHILCGRADSAADLCEGDIILTLDGKVCASLADLFGASIGTPMIADVFRNGAEVAVRVEPIPWTVLETRRLLFFCGAFIQRPHLIARHISHVLHSDVFISRIKDGTPADEAGISSHSFITAVNGTPTPTIDTFWEVVSRSSTQLFVAIHVISPDGIASICHIRQDTHYFPPYEFVKQGNGWKYRSMQCGTIL